MRKTTYEPRPKPSTTKQQLGSAIQPRSMGDIIAKNEKLHELEALRIDITNDKKKAQSTKQKVSKELAEASALVDEPDIIERTSSRLARIAQHNKTLASPLPTPTYDHKTMEDEDDKEDTNAQASSSSTSRACSDNDDNAQEQDAGEKVSRRRTTTDIALDDQFEKVSQTDITEKVSHGGEKVSQQVATPIIGLTPDGTQLPLEVLLDKNNISLGKLPVWYLQAMGVLGVDKLKRYAHLMGEDLPITEKIAMDLLLRTAEGDKEAQKIYWDLQKNLMKNPKILQQKEMSVKPNAILESKMKAIEAEVLDAENSV